MTLSLPEWSNDLARFDPNDFPAAIETAPSCYRVVDARLQHLEALARSTRAEMELSKSLSLGLAIAGCFTGNPIAWAAAALGGVGYLITLVGDVTLTGKVCPVPFLRKSPLTVVQGVGDSIEGNESEDDDPLKDIVGFLPPAEGSEFETLYFAAEQVAALVQRIKPEQRWESYRFILNYARRNGDLPEILQLQTAARSNFQEDAVVVEPARLPATAKPAQPTPAVPTAPTVQTVDVKPLPSPPSSVAAQPNAAATPTAEPDLKQVLWERLDTFEHRWLLQLMEATPILIYGPQRSGKTTLAVIIALLRQAFTGQPVEVNTPHTRDEFPLSFKTYRGYPAIGKRLKAYYSRIERGESSAITSLWDEYTTYGDRMDEDDRELAESFLMSVLAESEKHGELAILLSHGNTATYLGGTKGTSQSKKDGLIQIKRVPKLSSTGKKIPDNRVFISGLNPSLTGTDEGEIAEIPDWLTVEYLTKMLGREIRTNPELSGELEAVYRWALKRKGTIAARDVQAARIPLLQGYSSEQIRVMFVSLEKMGYGKTFGEDTSLTYSAE